MYNEFDCFAVHPNGRSCIALTGARCDGCGFYKTKDQLDEERTRSIERLKATGLWDDIRKKYGLEAAHD
jgi:hypothetical protein